MMGSGIDCGQRRWDSGKGLAVVERGIRWVLAVVFLYAGMAKLADLQNFATVLAGFGLLPKALLFPVALLLPAFEVVAGIGVMFAVRGSLAAIAGMLLLFMVVLAYGISLGLDIDCGCFGPEDPEHAYKGLRTAFIRDAVMLAAVVFVSWRRSRLKQRAEKA